MHIVLWVVQIVLGLAFLMAGAMKVTQSKEKLAENMGWVEDFTEQQVKGIGVLEILGAIGLIVPAFLGGGLAFLTPLAALGLALTMIGAAYTHYRRQETQMIVPNIVLLLLSLFVVYGRFVLEPIT